MARKRRKARKPIRYRKVEFKLTSGQKKRVDAYCRDYHTTPVTMMKKAIMVFLENKGYHIFNHRDPEPANQMTIFDAIGE